jgi:hypothetical protein
MGVYCFLSALWLLSQTVGGVVPRQWLYSSLVNVVMAHWWGGLVEQNVLNHLPLISRPYSDLLRREAPWGEVVCSAISIFVFLKTNVERVCEVLWKRVLAATAEEETIKRGTTSVDA